MGGRIVLEHRVRLYLLSHLPLLVRHFHGYLVVLKCVDLLDISFQLWSVMLRNRLQIWPVLKLKVAGRGQESWGRSVQGLVLSWHGISVCHKCGKVLLVNKVCGSY